MTAKKKALTKKARGQVLPAATTAGREGTRRDAPTGMKWLAGELVPESTPEPSTPEE